MKQMDISRDRVIDIDYESASLSRAVKDLRPVVWADQKGYCCILGPDPQEGVVGSGSSVEAALADWEAQLKERMHQAGTQDELAQYVIDTLQISKNDVW